MNFKYNNKSGFTLAEILIVMGIIGVLASIVLMGLLPARTKARDARRKADLHQLELAILMYNDDTLAYPDNTSTQSGDWPAEFKAQLTPYLPSLPKDPLENSAGRYYGAWRMTWAPDAICNGQYVLWTYLESSSDPDYGKYTCGFGTNHYFLVIGKY